MNNQVYVFGGVYVNQVQDNEEHLDYSRELFVSNPNSKEWNLLSLMNEKRCHVSSAALNNQMQLEATMEFRDFGQWNVMILKQMNGKMLPP